MATYFPKQKKNKKKSLLGNPKDSDESEPKVEVWLSGSFLWGNIAYSFMLLSWTLMTSIDVLWTNAIRTLQKVGDKKSDLKEEVPVEWVSLWKPNVTINLVDDFTR